MNAIDGVERRGFELGLEIGVIRNQVDVDGLDVAAVDKPEVSVAGGGHHIVLTAAAIGHQRHHLVR